MSKEQPGSVEGFVWLSLVSCTFLCCSKSINYTENLSLFWQFCMTFLMQVVFSATLSC